MSDRSEGEGTDTDAEPGLTPAAAFALLGEPTRLAIVRAIWEAPGDVVTFSAIRDRVGTEDTGRFNYHLGKLRGHFVRKVEDDGRPAAGYELRQAGTEVVRAVLAGVINEAPVREPTAFGAACPDCSGDLEVSYDGHGTVACADCGTVWMHNEFPPAGLAGRDAPALALALDRWTRHRSLLAFDGVCPSCASETVLAVEEDDGGPFAERICGHCEHASRAPLWALVVQVPEVAAFLHANGVEVRDRPFWELVALDVETTREDGGFALRFRTDGETLRVDLDADLRVVGTAREG
jgi:DNA-binding transcriptional ArsR family regulator